MRECAANLLTGRRKLRRPNPSITDDPAGPPPAALIRAGCAVLWLLRRCVDAAVLLLLAYMACAVLAQVIGRYFFNYSIA